MPLYDYRCPACGAFEAYAAMAARAHPRPCPRCAQGSPRLPSGAHIARTDLAPWAREERCRHEPLTHTHKTPTPRAGAARGRPWMLGH